MKFYKVQEYKMERPVEGAPIHYYMIFHRSLRTLFRWRWKCTVYSETWFKRQMRGKKYSIEHYTWSQAQWERD